MLHLPRHNITRTYQFIYFWIRSMDLTTFIQNNLALLQRYVFAQDKQNFLKTELTVPQDRKIFDFLLHSFSEREKQLVSEFRLTESDRTLLLNSKAFRQLNRVKSEDDKLKTVNRIKDISPHMSFDFPKPLEATEKSKPKAETGSEKEKKPVEGFETEATVEAVVLKALGENIENLAKLSPYGLKNLPPAQILKLNEKHAQFLFEKKQVLRSLDAETVAEFISNMITKVSKEKNTAESEEFPSDFFNTLSFDQLQALKKRKPKLFESYNYHLQIFKEKYEERFLKFKEIATLSFDERTEKKKLCNEALAELKNSGKDIFQNLIEKLTEEILLIDEASVNSDINLFVEYLRNIKSVNYENFDANFKTAKKEQNGRNKYLNKSYPALPFLESSRINQSEIINRTIVSLFKANNPETLELLAPFLNRKHLIKEQAKAKLSIGHQKDIPKLYEIFTADELAAIKDRREITLLPTNKKRFGVNDKVTLEVRLKNIKKITKKIYTIDNEKQLLQNNRSIQEDINLKFLVPEYQEDIVGSKDLDPFEEIKQTISFNQLDGKLGEFILELEGDGITSRAIIRKGHIFLKNKPVLTGHELTFYDEEGKQIDKLVIWRDNKKIDVKEKYFIPYGPQSSEYIIAVHNNHAERLQVQIKRQVFTFDCDYLYHSESFIVGNKAKIILRPILKLNDTRANLSRLQNVSISISSVNNQNITSNQVINNVTFSNNEDFVVEYPIKAYIKSFSLAIKAEVELIDKNITKLAHAKNITIDLEENYDNFVDIYLEKSYGGVYTAKIRGKNGENIANAQVSLSYEQFGINFSFNKDLTTDENGEVSLGKLLQVTKLAIKASQNGFQSTRSWKLNDFGESINYGGRFIGYEGYKVYRKVGESFTAPLPAQLDLNNDVIFQQYKKGFYYNKTSSVKLTKDNLTIDNLEVGNYTLILLRFNKKIELEVIQGKEWQGDQIITENNEVYKISDSYRDFLGLGNIAAETKGDNVEYSIDILSSKEELPKDLRVHIFAKNYIDSENAENVLRGNPQMKEKKDVAQFRNNSYFNNKKLSDQTAYVLNRKNQEVTNGNNLEKPHIFLKRIQVRATKENDEVLERQEAYKEMNYDRAYGGRPQMYAMRSKNAYAMDMMDVSNYPRMYGQSASITLNRSLNSHNNFLERVGHLHANLKQIKSITVPKGYNQLVVYLFSNNCVVKREYSLPDSKVEKLKLTHGVLRDHDEKTGWTMSREIYKVQQGETRQISRSSTWTAVSLSNVVQYAKLLGLSLPEWILSWRSYSLEKKLEVYDKEICHELNFFIYRNDPKFFNEVVKPFLRNKLRKTFVDFYLLDDKEELLKFSRTHVLNTLNYFEKAILAGKLREYGKKSEATNLASSLELPLKSVKKSNEAFKVFFETILNAKKQPTNVAVGGAFGASGGARVGDPFSAQFGAPPPPPAYSASMAQNEMYNESAMLDEEYEEDCQNQCFMMADQEVAPAKENFKAGFKETEKTKEYTETTYSGLSNPILSASLVPLSPFWAELAQHLSSNNANTDFLSDKFSDFSQKVEFVLACSILSNESDASFQLANHKSGYQITGQNSFLVFVREVKELPFVVAKNVSLNQRFFDPKNRYIFDQEGTQIEKEVTTFLIQKPYTVQTLITNLSGSNLELQLLMDIPEGSIPLLSHEQTQIINVSLPAYNTKSFEREFYFPEEGKYAFYPANACKGRSIIAKSPEIGFISVTTKETINTLESLDNILRSGNDEDILTFIRTRNIFDSNVFDFGLILWKLKDKEFYEKVVEILKERQYYHPIVWSFSLYHKQFDLVKEFVENNATQLDDFTLGLPIFEYYPYYSRRAHKFADENKSTIRVKQFRENYAKFLFNGIFNNSTKEPYFVLTHIYYLILQDRIAQARNLYKTVSGADRNRFKIQYDYIDCFLDMYEGASSDYKVARKISAEYKDYPVQAWKKLFNDVYETLHKTEDEESEGSTKAEEVAFSTTVVNLGSEIKINRPANVSVFANIYEIDIELYFSEFPFSDITKFSAIKPSKCVTFKSTNEFKVEKLDRKQFEGLKNIFVEIYEQKQNTALNKVSGFFWTNPDIKVKINEKEGTLKVFYKNKKCSTSYCKVYSNGSKGVKFSRDGYTDVASTFRYALDVKDITQFAILVLTDFGGSIHIVKPPSIY